VHGWNQPLGRHCFNYECRTKSRFGVVTDWIDDYKTRKSGYGPPYFLEYGGDLPGDCNRMGADLGWIWARQSSFFYETFGPNVSRAQHFRAPFCLEVSHAAVAFEPKASRSAGADIVLPPSHRGMLLLCRGGSFTSLPLPNVCAPRFCCSSWRKVLSTDNPNVGHDEDQGLTPIHFAARYRSTYHMYDPYPFIEQTCMSAYTKKRWSCVCTTASIRSKSIGVRYHSRQIPSCLATSTFFLESELFPRDFPVLLLPRYVISFLSAFDRMGDLRSTFRAIRFYIGAPGSATWSCSRCSSGRGATRTSPTSLVSRRCRIPARSSSPWAKSPKTRGSDSRWKRERTSPSTIRFSDPCRAMPCGASPLSSLDYQALVWCVLLQRASASSVLLTTPWSYLWAGFAGVERGKSATGRKCRLGMGALRVVCVWFPSHVCRQDCCDRVAAGSWGKSQPRGQGWLHPFGVGLSKRALQGSGCACWGRGRRHAPAAEASGWKVGR